MSSFRHAISASLETIDSAKVFFTEKTVGKCSEFKQTNKTLIWAGETFVVRKIDVRIL